MVRRLVDFWEDFFRLLRCLEVSVMFVCGVVFMGCGMMEWFLGLDMVGVFFLVDVCMGDDVVG